MQSTEPEQICGVLLVDKPSKITSHAVVAKLRKFLGIKKIGHAGTLDPMATGLMILLIGKKATKIAQDLIGLNKNYEGSFKLGETTDSFDADGSITSTCEIPNVTLDDLKAVAKTFIGDQMQLPPMFSAKKINGQRLYKMARKGQEIQRESNKITIFSFELTNFEEQNVFFKIECSKGTFIRVIAYDFGQKLKCGAHLNSLRRTKIGNFDIIDSLTLDEILNSEKEVIMDSLIPPSTAVEKM